MLSYLWSLWLTYPFLSTPLFQLIVTTIQMSILFTVFWFLDKYDIRLIGKSAYGSMNLALFNIIFLWVTILGVSSIIDMTPDRSNWPMEPPTWKEFTIQLLILIIVVDFFMYWLHRLYHYGIFYRWIHSVHHTKRNPVAVDCLHTHPIEFYSSILVFSLVPTLLNVHPLTSILSYFMLNIHGVLEHCGHHDYLETITLGFIAGSKTHIVHHNYFNANYGFYTGLWDYVFRTNMAFEDMSI